MTRLERTVERVVIEPPSLGLHVGAKGRRSTGAASPFAIAEVHERPSQHRVLERSNRRRSPRTARSVPVSRRCRRSRSSASSPPMASTSSTAAIVMNCGSIAIALSAEYGERSCGGSSLIGSSCTKRWPADSSHRASGAMSPISPIPQLRDEGTEKSGTRMPARRGCDFGSGHKRPWSTFVSSHPGTPAQRQECKRSTVDSGV